MFPDTPATVKACESACACAPSGTESKSGWLSEEERQLCLARLPHSQHSPLSIAAFRSSLRMIVSSWRFYLFSLLFTVSATAFEKVGVYTEFNLWLKSTGTYTTQQINYYPSIFTAVVIVATYSITVMSDATGNRFIVNPIMYAAVFISSVMLLVWDISTGAHFFAYIIGGIGYAGQASNVG